MPNLNISSSTFLVILLFLLSACGGGNSNVAPVESRVKVTDTKMWTSNDCIFYTNEGFASPVFSGDTTEIEYADEVIRISCTNGQIISVATLEDIDLYKNVESLTLGHRESSLKIGSLEKLPQLENLMSLELNTAVDDVNPEIWEQLNIENLSIVQAIPQINKISTLKSLSISVFDLEAVDKLSNLINLVELRVKFEQPDHIDVAFIKDLDLLDTLTIGIWQDDIGDFFPFSDDEDGLNITIKNFESITNLPNLKKLNIHSLKVEDLSLISNFDQLTDLSINGLTRLTDLLFETDISFKDTSPLKCGTNLKKIDFNENNINKLSFDASCENLVTLNFSDNKIDDVSPLSNLNELEELNINNNLISDLTPLMFNSKLTTLNLINNEITDVLPLYSLTNLIDIDISIGNHDLTAEDLEALRNATGAVVH